MTAILRLRRLRDHYVCESKPRIIPKISSTNFTVDFSVAPTLPSLMVPAWTAISYILIVLVGESLTGVHFCHVKGVVAIKRGLY